MPKICLCCQKTIGYFSYENFIYPESSHRICDKCNSIFGSSVYKIKASNDIHEFEKAYNDAIHTIQSSSLNNKDILQNEIKVLYEKRLSQVKQATQEQEENKVREEAQKLLNEEIEANFKSLSDSFLITTGYDFQGYRIVEYLGVVSDGVVQGTGFLSEFSADINDFLGTESNTFASKIALCRNTALQKVKYTALQKKPMR